MLSNIDKIKEDKICHAIVSLTNKAKLHFSMVSEAVEILINIISRESLCVNCGNFFRWKEDDRQNLGVGGKVYVNESLCPEYKRLQGICNVFRKKRKITPFFTINGKIRVAKTPEGKMFSIGHFIALNLIDLVGEAEVSKVIDSRQR